MKDTVSKILAPHKKKKIVISVSGGIDSLVLLDILMELNYSLVVVNFNHQQR
ncbi:MAG: tRNA(Ile)-lysidine synthetase, partial [Methanomicrobiales archaeon]|nr:tRNA(Ile)-lysidine synthetase [Methanomicrobiales archaeon]